MIMRTLTSLRVEPLAFVFGLSITMRVIANQQLILDKICRGDLQLDLSYCEELGSKEGPVKNLILGDATTFATKKELMGILPSVIMGMFVGVWCDMFHNGRRICLLLSLTGHTIESILCTLNAINFDWDKNWLLPTGLPTNMMGNGFFITAVSYIAANTTEKDRAFRFLLFDVCVFGGFACGYLLGGIAMATEHPIFNTPMHNYADNFAISGFLLASCIVYAFFVIKEERKAPSEITVEMKEKNGQMAANSSFDSLETIDSSRYIATDMSDPPKKKKRIFSFNHFVEAWQTLTKKREDNFHRVIWALIIFGQVATLPILGADNVIYPMTQRVYHWDYTTYSRVMTFATISKPIVVLGVMPAVFKFFKVRDLQISMIGVTSKCFGWIALGAIQTAFGFYTAVTVGCVATVSSLGVRSFLSKRLPEDEMTKIFSVVLTLEAMQPFIGSFIFSNIFRVSIDFYPTLFAHLTVIVLVGVLGLVAYIDCQMIKQEIREEEEERKEMEKQATSSRRFSVRRPTIVNPDDFRKMSVISVSHYHMSSM